MCIYIREEILFGVEYAEIIIPHLNAPTFELINLFIASTIGGMEAMILRNAYILEAPTLHNTHHNSSWPYQLPQSIMWPQ